MQRYHRINRPPNPNAPKLAVISGGRDTVLRKATQIAEIAYLNRQAAEAERSGDIVGAAQVTLDEMRRRSIMQNASLKWGMTRPNGGPNVA